MRLLTLSRNHDFNVCLYDSCSGFFRYVKRERETNEKHAGIDLPFLRTVMDGFSPDVMAMDWADEEMKGGLFGEGIIGMGSAPGSKIAPLKSLFDGVPCFWVDHHYSHVLSAWPLGQFDYGVAVDGRGPTDNTTMIFKNPFDLNGVETLYENETKDITVASFGHVFTSIGKKMGLGGMLLDSAGKVMGMSAYGESNYVADDTRRHRENICEAMTLRLEAFSGSMNFDSESFRNLIASIHHEWESCLRRLVLDYVPTDARVCFSGGAAQNTVFNQLIAADYLKAEFVPHCYDGGESIGCLAFLCLRYGLLLPSVSGFPYWQNDMVTDVPSMDTVKKVAQELKSGKIVGWHQGAGEIGPRALGNRSILMDPSISDGKKILNGRVKHREHWRPYAASVLEEHALDWFETDTPSPYMMRAIPTRENKRGIIPSVVHEDGTCRIQTVNRLQNPLFYDLIYEFYRMTGIPMLLNTSLNAGGKPISGSPEATMALLSSSDIDMVCIGSKLIEKKDGA